MLQVVSGGSLLDFFLRVLEEAHADVCHVQREESTHEVVPRAKDHGEDGKHEYIEGA